VELAEIAEERSKIALVDLMRLLSLNEKQAVYIISRHWDLVETFMIG